MRTFSRSSRVGGGSAGPGSHASPQVGTGGAATRRRGRCDQTQEKSKASDGSARGGAAWWQGEVTHTDEAPDHKDLLSTMRNPRPRRAAYNPAETRSAPVNSTTVTAPAPEIGIATRTLESSARPSARSRGRPTAMPPLRLLLAWALGSFIVGSIVAAGISFTRRGRRRLADVLRQRPVRRGGGVHGAPVGARLLFPLFERLPYALNLALQIFTLFAGTLFGSVMILTVAAVLRPGADPDRRWSSSWSTPSCRSSSGSRCTPTTRMRHQIEQQYQALAGEEAMERELADRPRGAARAACRAAARRCPG